MLPIARTGIEFVIILRGDEALTVFHGGNLAGAAQKFGVPDTGWVDLSTGINPTPYPIPDLGMDLWARLPDQNLLEDLKKAAVVCYGVPHADLVIPVSGTQILLQILPRLFDRPKKVRIVGPTYKEHEHCWKQAGHDVVEVPDMLTAEREGDIIIVVNPNNPTGDIYSLDDLLNLADKQHQKGGLLIVDGAFMDCTPSIDISPFAGRDGLVILRSFGKFFGLAGIRLGFVLIGGSLGERLKDGIGPWSVNGPALEIGRIALRDHEWITQMRQRLVESAKRLDEILQAVGFEICGGTSLFRYCKHKDAQGMYEYLGRNGILVRPFADQPNHLRFGLPAEESHWTRLISVLKST
jgi:cobalamin biosynthesis protein CobC